MRYQAVIFDLDGVICHTDEYHYVAWQQIAEELKIPFTREINDKMRGIDRMASLDILMQASGRVFSDDIKTYYADKKNDIYRKLLHNLSEADLDTDVKETLTGLRGEGLKLAIGSSSKNSKLILSHLGLGTFFDAVSDGTNATHAKPDPEIFLKAASMLAIEAAHCLVVEDAKAGLLAAKAAGMDSAAVGDARNYRLANYSLEKLSDLLKFV